MCHPALSHFIHPCNSYDLFCDACRRFGEAGLKCLCGKVMKRAVTSLDLSSNLTTKTLLAFLESWVKVNEPAIAPLKVCEDVRSNFVELNSFMKIIWVQRGGIVNPCTSYT